jgi:hypothetical protein
MKRSLKGPHKDVRDMRQFLIGGFKFSSKQFQTLSTISLADHWHYDPDDIVLLMNTDDPEAVQPTKENIVWFGFKFASLMIIEYSLIPGEILRGTSCWSQWRGSLLLSLCVKHLWLSSHSGGSHWQAIFSVAGHTMQKPTDDEEEEDGKDECECFLTLI